MSTFFEVVFIIDQNRGSVKSGGQIFEKRETVTAFYRAKTRLNGFHRPPPRSLNRSARSSKVKIMICSCWFYFSKLCGENQYLFGHFPPQFLSKAVIWEAFEESGRTKTAKRDGKRKQAGNNAEKAQSGAEKLLNRSCKEPIGFAGGSARK